MEFWEFLIQKEGDRSWLPLESPSVEVLEGRYRVVARTNRTSTPTEIRVTHFATDETPPVRRVRKRSGQTNSDGLIVILPFTRLQPGLWELRCTGDLMAEMLGETWQYAVQLDILPLSATEDAELEPIEPEWQMTEAMGVATTAENQAEKPSEPTPLTSEPLESEPATLAATEQISPAASDQDTPAVVSETDAMEPSLAAVAPVTPEADSLSTADSEADLAADSASANTHSANLAEVLEQVEQNSQQLVDAIFQNLTDFTDQPNHRDAAAHVDEVGDVAKSQLQVILERETFVIQRGELLDLVGRVELASEQSAEQVTVSELRVQLHDPQTSQLLMDEVHPINNRTPPFQFSGTISLPEHYQTYLVLGELIFHGQTAAGSPQVLAVHSFNVTTDLHELIESVANDFSNTEASSPEALPETAEPLLKSELSRLSSFQRSGQQPLPPRIRSDQPSGRTHATLDLPSFKEPEPLLSEQADNGDRDDPNRVDIAAAEAEDLDLTPAEISTSAADLLPPAGLDATQLEVADDLDKPPAADSPEPLFDWNELDQRLPLWGRQPQTSSLSNAPEDVSFRALNWQNRFLERLQALATNPEVSTRLGLIEAESAGEPLAGSSNDQALALPVPQQRPSGLDAELTVHEIVVDDEAISQFSEADEAEPDPAGLPLGPTLPEDEPIPTPRLQLPTSEMIAGQPIAVTVKLPSLLARVYVKLWLRDRQTRELLGTPRWIIDFIPDGFGNQMARTEVIVPPGCLKAQFEAIAVEIATQRESDKVTLTRPIVPPDLSPLSLDRLEI